MNKLIYILLTIVVITFILFKVSKDESFQLFGDIITRVETTEKVVALTFDDGPTKGKTEEILKILKENNVKATFYLVGKDIARNPIQTNLILEDEHEIGNHSYTHEKMILKSINFVSEEIEKTNQEIRNIGYSKNITFRPPYGKKLVILPYYLNKNDILSVTWDVEPDSALSLDSSPEDLVDYTLKHTMPGSIILMHVMFESRKNSMKSISGIIKGLKLEGYRFVTVSELLFING